jgi:hypothetical protein
MAFPPAPDGLRLTTGGTWCVICTKRCQIRQGLCRELEEQRRRNLEGSAQACQVPHVGLRHAMLHPRNLRVIDAHQRCQLSL